MNRLARLCVVFVVLMIFVKQCTASIELERFKALRFDIGQGRFSQAFATAGSLINEYPTFVPFYESFVEVSVYCNKLSEAEQYFQSRIEQGNSLRLSYFGKGLVRYNSGDYKSSVLLFDKAIVTGLQAPQCYKMLEYSYERVAGVDASIRYFSLLCHRNPENPNHWYGLALASWERRDVRRILGYLANAIARNPSEPRYLQARAAALALAGFENEATDLMTEQLARSQVEVDFEGWFFVKSHQIAHVSRNTDSVLSDISTLISTAQRLGYHRWEGWGYLKQADVEIVRGRIVQANQLARRSFESSRIAHDIELSLASLVKSFESSLELGRYDQAIEDALLRIRYAEERGDELHYVRALMDLGRTYFDIGKFDLALDYLSEATSRSENLTIAPSIRIQMRTALGLAYEGSKKYSDAIENFRIATGLLKHVPLRRQAQAEIDGEIGRCYLSIGKIAAARKYFHSQFSVSRRFCLPRTEAMALVNLGDCHAALGEYSLAIEKYDLALERSKALGLASTTLRSYRGLAHAYENLTEHRLALKTYAILFEALDHLIVPSVESVSFMAFNANVRTDLQKFVQLLIVDGKVEEAFLRTDQARSQETASLFGLPLSRYPPASPDSILLKADSLRERIVGLYGQLRRRPASRVLSEGFSRDVRSRAELAGLELSYDRMIGHLSGFKDRRMQIGSSNSGTIREVQTRLRETNEAILEYLVCEDRTILFVLTPDTLRSLNIEIGRDSLDNLLAGLTPLLNKSRNLDLIWNPVLAEFDKNSSREIFYALIAPAQRFIAGISKLVIVPDGNLHNLPFELLCSRADEHTVSHDFREVRFLVEDYEVSYALSFSGFKQHENVNIRSGWVLAIGNENSMVDVEPEEGLLSGSKGGIASLGTQHEVPGVRREIARIKSLFGSIAAIDGEMDVSKENLGIISRGFNVIHIASHSRWDENNPLASSLQLPSPNMTVESMILKACEVPGMRIRASLVVLSGCNTARWSATARNYGFVRGFFSGGAASIVGALWPIDDEATTVLMERFYAHMKDGKSNTRALQLAKIDLIHSGWSDPFYWGGFILIGQRLTISAAESDRGSPVRAALLVAGIGSVLLLFAFRRVIARQLYSRTRRL